VLEMMKYKTWWYIYRRSIREVVSKLLNRYFNPQEPSKPDEKTKRLHCEHFKLITDQMNYIYTIIKNKKIALRVPILDTAK
jgi:hypothetical protein